MKNSLSRLCYFSIYLLVSLAIGLFIRDYGGQAGLFFSLLDVANHGSLFSDPSTFAKAAHDIYQHGWFTNYLWVLYSWPPGFMLLEGIISKVFGGNAPVVLILVILSSVFLAFVLTLLRERLSPILGNIWAGILPLTILCFPVGRVFLLEPAGIIFGETFAISCILLTILFILRAIDKKLLSNAIYAGIFFALSAYFRSQFEFLILIFTILAVPMLVWQKVAWQKQQNKSNRDTQLLIIKAVALLLIVTHLLMLPWRIYTRIELGHFAWVQTSHATMLNALASDDTLLAQNGSFVIAGAGNLACKLEPSYCDKKDISLFYKSFIHHIGQWYKIRSFIVSLYWYAPLFSYPKDFSIIHLSDHIYNSILFLLILGIISLLVLLRKTLIWSVLIWINVSFFSAFFIIFTVAQIESRYFYLVKIYSIFMFIILLIYYLKEHKLLTKKLNPYESTIFNDRS